MHQHKSQTLPPHPALYARCCLRLFVVTVFMLLAVGCLHQPPEQPTPSRTIPAVEKRTTPASTPSVPSAGSPAQPQPRVEQPDKSKTGEKKSPNTKEKKATASTDRGPSKKLERAEEPSADTFAPPPPTKPPTFGGAGG